MNSLEELTSVPSLLAQQSEDERKQFSELKFLFSLVMHEARFAEERPHLDLAQDSTVIGVGEYSTSEIQYFGVDMTRMERNLVLVEPIDVACKDDTLNKSFFSWERAQGWLPSYINIIRTALAARSVEKLEQLAEEIGSDKAEVFEVDVTDYAAQESMVASVLSHFGRIDAVFANAGVGGQPGGFSSAPVDSWQSMVSVNVLGVAYTLRARNSDRARHGRYAVF